VAVKLEVRNGKRVAQRIEAQSLEGRAKFTVDVGYSARYARVVHEDLEARHPRGGQAKFLEAPARRLRGVMAAVIRQALLGRRSLEAATLRAANLLLFESKKLCPVDTGHLRQSGYARVR
jgi:hypothetical protein